MALRSDCLGQRRAFDIIWKFRAGMQALKRLKCLFEPTGAMRQMKECEFLCLFYPSGEILFLLQDAVLKLSDGAYRLAKEIFLPENIPIFA